MSDTKKSGAGGRPGGFRPGGPMGGPGFGGPVQKARDFKGTIKKLIRYLGEYRYRVLLVLLFSAGSAVFAILGPKVLGNAITSLFEGLMSKISGGTGVDFEALGRTLLLLLGLYVTSSLLGYMQGWVMSGIAMKISYRLRRDISEKLNRMPLRYFDGTNHGEVLSRVTNDVDTVSQTLGQSLSQMISSLTTLVGVLVMMLTINCWMTLVALLMMPLSLLLIVNIVKLSQKHFKHQQEGLGKVNGHVEEMFSGHVVMKAFNGEKKSMETFDGINKDLYNSAWKSQFISGMMMPIMTFIGNFGYVVICIMGGWLAARGAITVGDIQAFVQYVRMFTQPMSQIATIANTLQQTAAAAERVFEFLEEAEETPDAEALPTDIREAQGHVAFQNVHFGYSEDKIIINDFSAEIQPGQKVAIVGPTGAGKTTMVKLLMRFYDVTEGAILLDGSDVRSLSRAQLRSKFGMVLQDTWLFNGTIMENLRYGRLDATDEEVYAAARAAHVDAFVRTLLESYRMVLNEEASNISQGQKQLLTIARAILANPRVLILDEATSSVDTHTEILIQKAMDTLMRGRTSFVIAHRLSTIRDADLILVMNHGDIVEQGTHEELLAKGGFYAELYNSQFEVQEAV